jgi:hypothetical protein
MQRYFGEVMRKGSYPSETDRGFFCNGSEK